MKQTLNNIVVAAIIIIIVMSALMLGNWIAPTNDCAEYPSYVRGDC